MAGASMNDIKSRIKSVSGTMQITKAMELVATSKLRRARERAERARPFQQTLLEAISAVMSAGEVQSSAWVSPTGEDKTLYVVIAGDRGLAGGYNSNVFRLTSSMASVSDSYLPIGKKSVDYYTHRNLDIFDKSTYVADVSVGDALIIASNVCRAYLEGKFNKVVLVYTKFASMISQIPTKIQLLPLCTEHECKESGDPIYCGDPEEILDKIIPEYIGGILNSAICESLASECGARRTAMNAANKNASEMIDSLMLKYNRARQAVITQEITEIVSGSETL